MQPVVRRFFLPLLLSGSFASLWSQTATDPAAQESWYGQPQPRKETFIVYRPVQEIAPLPQRRLSAAEISPAPLAAVSAVPWGDGAWAGTWLLGGEKLVGRVTLDLAPPEAASSPAPAVLVQLKGRGGDFETVASTTAADAGPLQLTFPGRQATALRILVSGAAGSGAPLTAVAVEEIELAAATRIMLLGDSITDGKYSDDGLGFRKNLYDRLTGGGFSVDFVGSYGSEPYESHFQGGRKTFDFYPNNGIRTPQLDATGDMDNYRPNVVAIHLGTNNLGDIGSAPTGPYGTPAQFNTTPAGQMASLIKYLLRWRDGSRGTELEHIFLCLIAPIKSADSLVAIYNIQIAAVARDFASGAITGRPEPVHIVDLYTRFYENPAFNNDKKTNYPLYFATSQDPNNRLHPNNAGHLLMGLHLYEAMKPWLSGTSPWFTDRSWESNSAGFDAEYNYQGIAVADVNGDSRPDLYTTRAVVDPAFRRDLFLLQGAAGEFSEAAERWGIQDAGESRGALFADIDNDGDLDLFNGNTGRNRLYENLEQEDFREITTTSGLEDNNELTTALLAFDAEGDDDIDLYAVNSRKINEFYLNDGFGRFRRADRGADDSDEPAIPSESAAAADFDNDGDIDIYIAKRGAANALFVNNGAGYFSEGAAAAGLAFNHNSRGVTWADLDNDADLDLLIPVSASSSDPNPLLHIFRNRGSGLFEEVTSALNIPMSGFSLLTGDFDLDGDLDLITTGDATSGAFYRNNGNWNFSLLSNTGSEVTAGDTRSGVVLDHDGDGDLDFYLTRSDIFNVLKENRLASGFHYLKVEVEGPGGSGSAFGSKIWCWPAGRAGDPAALLGYRQVLSGTGHLAQYPLTQHFGLGSQTLCDLLVQFTDNTFLLLRSVPADQTVKVGPQAPAVVSGTAAQLAVWSGDGQSAPAGTPLAQPLAVRALDAKGAPVPGQVVDFSVTAGDAAVLAPESSEAGDLWIEAESGRTSPGLAWAYDATASNQGIVFVPPHSRTSGRDTLTLTLPAADARSLWVRARAAAAGGTLGIRWDSGSLSSHSITGSDWQWLRLGSAGSHNPGAGSHRLILELAPGTLQVDRLLLTTSSSFTPTGTGASGADPYATDSEGIARRRLLMGKSSGPVAITARATADGRILTAAFAATVLPGEPATIAVQSGNNQVTTLPGSALPAPLVVVLRDAFGNPVPGQKILFTVRSGGGSLIPADGVVLTDSRGLAAVTLVTGTANGLQQAAAIATALPGSEALFSATVAGNATNLALLQGGSQSDSVMARLAQPLRFQVTSSEGKPVASYPLLARALQGGRIAATPAIAADSLLQLFTASDGTVTLYWQLGPVSGDQFLQIETPGLLGSPLQVKAVARPAAAYRLLVTAGDRQSAPVTTRLPLPMRVRVADRYGNGISGQTVQFRIIAGGGSFNGASQTAYSTTTDAAGSASVQLTLGTIAGENISRVDATALVSGRHLAGSPLSLYATAVAGPPAVIFSMAGNQQSGVVGTLLPDSLAVALKDYYQNVIVNHQITFSVTSGDGQVNGVSQAIAYTDNRGEARVQFRLGRQAGADKHQVTAMAKGLTSESALFRASGRADVAARISYLSGNGQNGVVRTTLTEPLVVQIGDRYGNAVANHAVQWKVISGGGTLAGSTEESLLSDENGQVHAWLTLGQAAGDSAHRVTATAVDKNFSPLNGSPVTFYANGVEQLTGEADRLELLSSEEQSGEVNEPLETPLRLRVSDRRGLPVQNHPVEFVIIKGDGRLGNARESRITLASDRNGEVAALWQLGTTAGDSTQAVEISCLNSDKLPVTGSPRRIYAAAQAGSADSSRSGLSVETPVAADGVSASQIVVSIRDQFGNPVPNQGILLVHSGLDAALQPNQGYTDGQGRFIAQARSAIPGLFTIQVRVAASSRWLSAPQSIGFVNPGSKQLELAGGDGQSAPVASQMPQPLTVRVMDSMGRPLPGIAVLFALTEGEGELHDPETNTSASGGSGTTALTRRSDAEGRAAVILRTGVRSGRLQITATLADDPQNRQQFQAIALPGTASELAYIDGNQQNGIAWHRLSRPLRVQIRDAWGNGVPGTQVTFSATLAGSEFAPSASVISDSSGTAAVLWYLGGLEGRQFAQAAATGLANSPLSFSAAAEANHAPALTLPDSLMLKENDAWSLQIEVSDLEGDSIALAVDDAPAGLTLIPGGRLEWRPDFSQAGRHWLTIEARDRFGAVQRQPLLLVVANVNRPPLIVSGECLPAQQDNIRIEKPEPIDFKVAVSDPDLDVLSYRWYVNGALTAYGRSEYRLPSEVMPAGDLQVKVLVSDGKSTVTHTWNIMLVSAVRLVAFNAAAEPGHGIRLRWQTRFESGHLGFYLQRSRAAAGPFEVISALLPPAPDGAYSYLDGGATAGTRYWYRLQEVASDGSSRTHTAVQGWLALPEEFALSANYPNPFNAQTRLTLSVPAAGALDVLIIDQLGRQVRRLFQGESREGYQELVWDGKDDLGAGAASGVYYCRAALDGRTVSRKLVLVK